MRIYVLFSILPICACGQNLSIGVIGGASPSADFQNQRFLTDGPGFVNYSTPKRYALGAMLEYRLPSSFSIELDGIYHPLGYTFAGLEPDGSLNSVSPASVVTWEFPILAKYRFDFSRVKPFVEAGPSFRTAGNLNSANPSHCGATGGLGVEMRLGSLKIAPVVRYTRWARDKPSEVRTVPDQLELLVGLSASLGPNLHPLGSRVSIGAIAGVTLTGDFRSQTERQTVNDNAVVEFFSGPGPKSFLRGAMLELALPRNFSAEVNVIYEPLKGTSRTTIVSGNVGLLPGKFVFSEPEWKFPALAKYRFHNLPLTPFAELGPSFRLPPGDSNASKYGVTAGAGFQVGVRNWKISPVLRYTRWGPDKFPQFSNESLNQAEVLTSFSF
jgi:hypothetical protein